MIGNAHSFIPRLGEGSQSSQETFGFSVGPSEHYRKAKSQYSNTSPKTMSFVFPKAQLQEMISPSAVYRQLILIVNSTPIA